MGGRTNGRQVMAAAIGLAMALGASDALAQGLPPGCVASGNPQGAATGALLGGVAGALLGNAVSGKHKAGGTIIGGLAGAATGAAIGGNSAAPCPDGYIYRARPVEDAPLPVSADDDVWDGAPPRVGERIGFLRHRVERLDRAGWLSPRESDGLFHRLSAIQRQEEGIRDRNDGMLPPDAREQLTDELNDVARRLRWKEYRNEHAGE